LGLGVNLFSSWGGCGFQNINPESTPADIDLEDDDQIDCFLQQTGGMKN
jgi:hypothetical protein